MNKPVYLQLETQSLQNGHSRGQVFLSVIPQDMELFGSNPPPILKLKVDYEQLLEAFNQSASLPHGKINATLCNS